MVLAHAKINLFLRVLGRRADGYHDIESLVVPISLSDRVWIHATTELHHLVTVDTGAGGPSLGPEGNLVSGAAQRLDERSGGRRGWEIGLTKRIPVAAGLGGGSADAAAVLRALNDLWECGLTEAELLEVAADVGSDVPALLRGRPVLMRGRGEILDPVEIGNTWWVLLPQDLEVSTPQAYRWWDEEGSTGPDPGPLLEAAADGRIGDLGALLFNDLEALVARRHSELGEARRALVEAGALGAVMSGSGPTMAALARDEAHARDIADRVPGAIPVSAPP
jgi:4-diphosphocytidyl-2-C-methyl-D-erythritol kinase